MERPITRNILSRSRWWMLTSIDLFFKTKDASLPVSVEIRDVVNGYPGKTTLPFSIVTKNPDDVNLSEDGSVATTFTFESPVYVEEVKKCVL